MTTLDNGFIPSRPELLLKDEIEYIGWGTEMPGTADGNVVPCAERDVERQTPPHFRYGTDVLSGFGCRRRYIDAHANTIQHASGKERQETRIEVVGAAKDSRGSLTAIHYISICRGDRAETCRFVTAKTSA